MEHSAPLQFASLCVFIAGAAVLSAAMLLHKPFLPAPKRRAWILPLGLFPTALTFGEMLLSPLCAGSALASVLGNLQPFFGVVLAAAFRRERLNATKVAAMILGILGVTLIVLSGSSPTFVALPGVMLAILSSGGAAIGTAMIRHLAPKDDWLALASWQPLAGGTILLIASLLADEPPIHWSPAFLGVMALLALAETALMTVFWF